MASTIITEYNAPSEKEKAEVCPKPQHVIPSIEESVNLGAAGCTRHQVSDHWTRPHDHSLRADRDYNKYTKTKARPAVDAVMESSPIKGSPDNYRPHDAPTPQFSPGRVSAVPHGSMPHLPESYLQSPAGTAASRVHATLPTWARSPAAVVPPPVSLPVSEVDGQLSNLRSSLMSMAEQRV